MIFETVANEQVAAFQAACGELALQAIDAGAALLVLGDTRSPAFPVALRRFVRRRTSGRIKLNLMVNYSWPWDLAQVLARPSSGCRTRRRLREVLGSAAVSRVASSYAGVAAGASPDSFRFNAPTPISTCATHCGPVLPDELFEALAWYQEQDVTLGG